MGTIPTTRAVPDADIQAMRIEFVDRMWKGMLVVAIASWPITLWRIHALGWLPLFSFHLGLATMIGVLAVLQRSMPFRVRAAVLFCLLWAVGVPGVFSFGLAAASILWLILSCLVAATLYSARAGALVAAATVLLLLGAGYGYSTGRLHTAVDADTFLAEPSSWGALIVVTGIFCMLVLQSFGAFIHTAERLLVRIKQQRDEIEQLSLHDPLTGLPLSGLANDRIQMAMNAARRAGKRMGLLFVDLDAFKRINDSLGHEVGDVVLRISGERMIACLRSEDTVARIGGDEFLVVLGGIGEPSQAARVSEKLIRAIGQPIDHQGRQLQVGASIGIALFPDDAQHVQDLRRMADKAMYEAKRQGRNRYEYAREPAEPTEG